MKTRDKDVFARKEQKNISYEKDCNLIFPTGKLEIAGNEKGVLGFVYNAVDSQCMVVMNL